MNDVLLEHEMVILDLRVDVLRFNQAKPVVFLPVMAGLAMSLVAYFVSLVVLLGWRFDSIMHPSSRVEYECELSTDFRTCQL